MKMKNKIKSTVNDLDNRLSKMTHFVSQIRYSLVVILELNSVSEVQYKDIMINR